MSIILSVTLSVLSEGHDLDLDMIAFLLVSLISQEEGVEVTEEQRTWWRVAEIMEIMVSSPASPLAATFQAGGENFETTMIIRSVATATTQTEECPRSQEDLETNTTKTITSVSQRRRRSVLGWSWTLKKGSGSRSSS